MQEKPIETALQLALNAHRGQVDKGGQSYILHPLRLMMHFCDETLQIISLLHDVVEDSHITLEQIEQLGFDQIIVGALTALTKKENETYEHYIERVCTNKLAIQVKMADLTDNLNMSRITRQLTEADLTRLNKYHSALMYLSSLYNDR